MVGGYKKKKEKALKDMVTQGSVMLLEIVKSTVLYNYPLRSDQAI